jgi:DNA-binding transcriptional ArsR family regulator
LVNKGRGVFMKTETKDLLFWTGVFKGLGNPNRLKILKLLNKNNEMSVGSLAEELEISFKNTSWNLKILRDLGIVEYRGKQDRVFYYLNPRISKDIRTIINLSIL